VTKFLVGLLIGIMAAGWVFKGMLRGLMGTGKLFLTLVIIAIVFGLLMSLRSRNAPKER